MKDIPLYEVRPISSIKDMLYSSAELYSARTAFLAKKKGSEKYSPITYKQFRSDVDAFGTALMELGLGNKAIALIGENRYEWSVSYLATLCGVGTIVPLDKELPLNEIESLLTRSKASAVIYSGSSKGQIAEFADKLDFIEHFVNMDDIEAAGKFISFNQLLAGGHELLKSGNTGFINAEIDAEAVNVLLFTSGTTDTSKAVMLSHRNLCTNLMSMSSMLCINPSDVFLSILPIHHTYECTCGFLCPIYRGAAVAYFEGLRHIPKNMQESSATVVLGVPLIFEAMYKRIWDQAAKSGMTKKLKLGITLSNFLRKFGIDITRKLFAPVYSNFGSKVRLFISGAAGIDPVVAKGFRDLGIHFVQGYGLTECSPIVALNRDVDFKDDAAGIPLPNLEVRIDNPGADGIGEIAVKGPSVMLGYYQNPEATDKVLKDGWFYTGDAGYMDEDKFIHITGRIKDVIVTKNGKNIYPEEIETLVGRIPYVKESLVYGASDEESGDVVVSCIVVPDMEKIQEQHPELEISSEATYKLILDEIKAINKTLVNYKHIKYLRLKEEEFAKTTSKKIKRFMETKV